MDKLQTQVLEFHKTFDCVINDKPTVIDSQTARLRIALIEEELNELVLALGFGRWSSGVFYDDPNNHPNLVEIADALGDLLYVTIGAAVSCGIDLEPVTDEIHRSNMSKVCEDGTVLRRADNKILKPDTYSPADLASVLLAQT